MNQELKREFKLFTVGLVAIVVAAGCGNIGSAPEGPSGKELQANFDKLPVEKRIELIKNGPAPEAEKKRQIEALQGKSAG